MLVRIGTRVLHARVQGDVRPGGTYRAEVVSTGRTLVLRTLERPAERLDATALARAHSLPPGSDSEAVVRAFVRSGLPLQAERLALALRRVRSTLRLSVAERARLAAVLEDKGLLDAREAWDRSIVGAGGGTDDGRREEESGGRDRRSSGDRRRGTSDDEVDRGKPIDQAGLPTEANEHPEGGVEVSEAFRPGDHADDVLQLVNHRSGREDAWILVPIEFAEGADLHASVRMRLRHPSEPGAADEPARFLEAVLDVRSGGQRWTFGIRPIGESLRVNALAAPQRAGEPSPSGGGGGPPWDELAERLQRIGIDFDLTLMSKDSNDGFSTEESADIIQSIDSRA